MINKEKKAIMGCFLAISLLIFSLISFVSAVGVGGLYTEDSPLEMYAGQKTTVTLNLQNADIEEGVDLKGVLLEGSEIASLDGTIHNVPYKGKIPVELKINIPADARVGDEYTIKYKFEQASANSGGVSIGIEITTSFKVLVVPETPSEGISTTTIIYWIIGIIVVIAIIWFVMKKKNE